MNFQPIDYLSHLNLDFDLEAPNNVNDLDLFGQSEFFDLDVFSKDRSAPTKQEQLQQHQKKEELSLDFLEMSDKVKTPQYSPPVLPSSEPPKVLEDKRKRNTAASARFRIKKKMKERQMEEETKALQEKVLALEKRLKTLETENKCLKNLILKNNEKKNDDLLNSIKKKSLLDFNTEFHYTT